MAKKLPKLARKPSKARSTGDEICVCPCFFCEPARAGLTQNFGLSEREIDIVQCLILGDDDNDAAAL